MKANQRIVVLILLGIISTVTEVRAQMTHTSADHIMVVPNDIKWTDAPPSLPPGAKVAVIEGDPKADGLFTMRLKFPSGYKIKPHFHPVDEHITVISGSFHMGLGEQYDEKTARKIVTGGFAVMNTGTRHYAFTTQEAIIQLHGKGPWGITYVNPVDDPRNTK